ncbi:MAG TPA: SprT family zinc-dependent metalloprotease [Puia sp.]|nr:SprT family zinc-dependent metalloprotease [Puia sp.]
MPDYHIIRYGAVDIEYALVFNVRKTLGIRVFPDCRVQVVAPLQTDISTIEEKIRTKAAWIIRQQRAYQSFLPHTPERLFVNGETHLYFGRQYKLRVEHCLVDKVKLFRGRLIICCRQVSDPKNVLNKWYKEKAVTHFHEILQKILLQFKDRIISKPILQVRAMHKRWGSCTPSGRIILNPELIKASRGSIEYVIIHELCHLVYRNHTKAFYRLQEKVMPDWKKWKEKLEYSLA